MGYPYDMELIFIQIRTNPFSYIVESGQWHCWEASYEPLLHGDRGYILCECGTIGSNNSLISKKKLALCVRTLLPHDNEREGPNRENKMPSSYFYKYIKSSWITLP